jgi:UDP-glucuronate 4-epimerase
VRILVLGAAGFIGSAVARLLLDSSHEVVAIDNLNSDLYPGEVKAARLSGLLKHPNLTFVNADLRSIDIGTWVGDCDVVINEAAMPGLVKSWSEFDIYMSSNILIVQRLLDTLRSWPEVRLVHASTSSVYGRNAVGGEDAPKRPFSPYGVTKLCAENLITAYHENFGIRAVVLRYFSVFGPGQRPDMAYSLFCNQLLSGETLTIYGDGYQTRSNTFIDDVARATMLACISDCEGVTMNICSPESISLANAINTLASELGVEPKLDFRDSRAGDQVATAGEASLAESVLGWRPQTSIEAGLRLQATAAKEARG